MARIRTIKPEFWTDEKIVELSAFARLLFIGLWNFADDEGRMVCSPKRIKMQIFPADSVDCSALLGEIRGNGLISMYVVDGQEYLQINGFARHQKVDKRTPSKLPPTPDIPAESPRTVPTEGKGREWKGMEGNGREGKEEGNGEAPVSPAIPPKPPKRATQLPDDFTPNETGVQYAQTRQVALTPELEAFRNWHVAKGTTMKDWQAAWRTWCDKAVEFGRAGQAPNARASPRQTAAQEREQVSRILTGRGGDAGRNERDITGETERIA